jgi:hypothetical protein
MTNSTILTDAEALMFHGYLILSKKCRQGSSLLLLILPNGGVRRSKLNIWERMHVV